MDRKTAEVLVNGLQSCFVSENGRNIADVLDDIQLHFKHQYTAFNSKTMSLSEANTLKMEESLLAVAEALRDAGREISESITKR